MALENAIKIQVPNDWPYKHIPTWEYDEDGDLEVSRFECGHCIYHQPQLILVPGGTNFINNCKCLNHRHVHFGRSVFSCDELTAKHMICKAFEPSPSLYPAGCLEWEALGGFDEWFRIWKKQWYNNSLPRTISLIGARHPPKRDFSDDIYYVPYDDFINCNIIHSDGIHCADYRHIEISRSSVIGYKWVSEGPGLWIPWEDNRYIKFVRGD